MGWGSWKLMLSISGVARQRKAAAMEAANLNARQAHLESAERYHDFATSIEARERYLGLNADDEADASAGRSASRS